MNQFIKSISDLDKKADLKKQKLKEIKLQEQKEKESLKEQERQEEDIQKEIEFWTSNKYVLENYKKIHGEDIKASCFGFLIFEILIILIIFVLDILLGYPPINTESIVISIFYTLANVIVLSRNILRAPEIIREVKKNYKLEEVIEKIKENEKELSKVNQKKEEIKENLNQLNIQISNLENQLENIRIKRSQELNYYEWIIKKITKKDKIEMYTKEIQELCDRRKKEMDVLINDEFDQREKSTGLTLKRQK